MYYDKFYPFYMAYSNPLLYSGEKAQEEEFELMKSYYPAAARKIQEKVENECQLLDYEGSRIYDEYPDRFMLYRLSKKIRDELESEMGQEMQAQAISGGVLDDLVQVLLFQEISRRRCRHRRCRRFF